MNTSNKSGCQNDGNSQNRSIRDDMIRDNHYYCMVVAAVGGACIVGTDADYCTAASVVDSRVDGDVRDS